METLAQTPGNTTRNKTSGTQHNTQTDGNACTNRNKHRLVTQRDLNKGTIEPFKPAQTQHTAHRTKQQITKPTFPRAEVSVHTPRVRRMIFMGAVPNLPKWGIRPTEKILKILQKN